MINNISVTILTKNSEKYLVKCLESVKAFSEIIILDNGSTDRTIEIAQKFTNTIIIKNDFIGFGPLKNLAAEKASNNWIFSLDSDEIIEESLIRWFKETELKGNTVYAFRRKNYYSQKWVKSCGWYPDYVLRLYNRKKTSYLPKLVHESIDVNNMRIERIGHHIFHYTFEDVFGLLDKMQRYSELYAEEWKGRKKSSPVKAVLRAIFSFFRNFFLKKGLFYGYEGFIISICNSLGVFFKYIKLYEKNRNK
ncbi:MAG: glycosyltransferase family 2 protein [Candidatus Muiribacteriaceae bacterium]